jgi:hypothetical protein
MGAGLAFGSKFRTRIYRNKKNGDNKMKIIKIIFVVVVLQFQLEILPQHQSIFIFDPAGVSTGFQYTLSQLTQDPVFVADSLDDSIHNYDAAFLFMNYPFILSQDEGALLTEFTTTHKPIYIYSDLVQDLDSVDFWNYIGVDGIEWLLISVFVDSVTGTENSFLEDIKIDTSFWSGAVPVVSGNIEAVLVGHAFPIDVFTTYIPSDNTLRVIVDLFNLIDDEEYLKRVLEYFELISDPPIVEIHFFPAIDTAWIYGGCVGPDIIAHNHSIAFFSDTIIVEPGPNSVFFYYDSLGNTIQVDNYYFIINTLSNQYYYELWFHPKSWPPFDPILIPFDSVFYFYQNDFDIQLVVKFNGVPIDSLSQLFRAEWGLSVEGEDQIPEHFSLSQNYPNPFNPSTKIKYTIPLLGGDERGGLVTLKVYDILGNEIAALVNEEKQPGTYEVEFNTSSIKHLPSSGVYFYRLKAGNYIETKKMVLTK